MAVKINYSMDKVLSNSVNKFINESIRDMAIVFN